MLSRCQIVPHQYRADVAQVHQRDLPVLRTFRHVRQGVGDPSQQIGQLDPPLSPGLFVDEFTAKLATVVIEFATKMTGGGHIALIIQPTQWNAPAHQFTDHIYHLMREVEKLSDIKVQVDMRFSVPYESQQCNAQMVEWAKANRCCLVLSREIVVWRV